DAHGGSRAPDWPGPGITHHIGGGFQEKPPLPWILPALVLEITARRGGFLLGLRKPSFDLTFKGRRTALVAVG
ncbi:MAG: hypothetical protein VX059_01530, partial [SAR324 cluster bacterium]|nr:hypothetical protein [SAR324 cluster bacterium]